MYKILHIPTCSYLKIKTEGIINATETVLGYPGALSYFALIEINSDEGLSVVLARFRHTNDAEFSSYKEALSQLETLIYSVASTAPLRIEEFEIVYV